ncbi:MAG: hypothetical protein ACHQNE_08005 [Candidatus Kapaibacterium sp.]
MKKHIALVIAFLIIAPLATKAQELIIHRVTPREYVPKMVNGKLTWVVDTVSLDPVYFTTQRERDSIRILDFTELLREDHQWLSWHVWRTDSADGLYRMNRIARNEVNLREADSTFTARYGNRYTSS